MNGLVDKYRRDVMASDRSYDQLVIYRMSIFQA
jgi:hypothetical protein